MNLFQKLFRFAGGVAFAIILILLTLLFVISGTFIESITDSHRYASYFTYGNPLFITLLWGFFLNILVSSLRRWPFQKKHIPFLITHLGLLMILGGVLFKGYYGIQGNMALIEGSGSHHILLPDTYSIHLEKRDKTGMQIVSADFPLKTDFFGRVIPKISTTHPFNELKLQLKQFVPHSQMFTERWIKGDFAYIRSMAPIHVDNFQKGITEHHSFFSDALNAAVIAGITDDIEKIAEKFFIKDAKISINDGEDENLFEMPLEEALTKDFHYKDFEIAIELNFGFSSLQELQIPGLKATIKFNNETENEMFIPLQGEQALQNLNVTTPHLGKLPLTLEIKKDPLILLLQDSLHNLYLFSFDPFGRVFYKTFPQNQIGSVIVYDRGFGGYGAQVQIPSNKDALSRKKAEKEGLKQLAKQMEEALKNTPELAPPLKIIKGNLAENLISFLSTMDQHYGWLLDEENQSIELDWSQVPEKEKKGCYWICAAYAMMEQDLKRGKDLIELLKNGGWPFVDHLPKENSEKALTGFAQQILAYSDQLPEPEIPEKFSSRLFSAYLRAYDIRLPSITNHDEKMETLECPITASYRAAEPEPKLEDNFPAIVLNLRKGETVDQITLAYDKGMQGFKWPIFRGEYLVRFQPHLKEIPYHIRLRNAKQVNYSNSNQPYSYESDLIITDQRDGNIVESRLSMNNVYETWDGYRFYLSNISANDQAAKRIQLIVNHDPAKYGLTYPGAFFLSLGIFLLFFWPQRKRFL